MTKILSFLSMMAFLSAFPALGMDSHVQGDATSYNIFILDGSCAEAQVEFDTMTTTWPLDSIDSEEVGSKPYPDLSTAHSSTVIDASLEDLSSEPRGIGVYDIFADSEVAMQACGDLGLDTIHQSEWRITLSERNESGLNGLALINQMDLARTEVSVYMWGGSLASDQTSGDAILTAPPTSTPGLSEEEPSGPGGIGNTREDILDFWKVNDNEVTAEITENHFHYVTYDLPNYQISFMFQLSDDDQKRSTDRAVDIIVSWIAMTSRSDADQRVSGWLPQDAKKVDRVETNQIGESIQRYASPTIAKAIPKIDHLGFAEPGSIWVTYWPSGSEVGVVEISLFHPRAE